MPEQDWTRGQLPDHRTECPECGGAGGFDEVDEEGPYPDECEWCEGSGWSYWPSFYEADDTRCDICHRDPVALMETGEPGIYICVSCYVEQHRDSCGCDLWREAEADLLEEESHA